MGIKIIGKALPNIPWEDKPSDCFDIMWRYSKNPIIGRNFIKTADRIFNSAVIHYNGEFIGVFRAEHKNGYPKLHLGRSKDGLNWEIEGKEIEFVKEDGSPASPILYAYDPRLVEIDGEYFITWCNYYYGPTIGVAKTKDFKTFIQYENAFLPYNRNGVLFPKKLNGYYAMLNRPSDRGHTPFGDIFISYSPDLIHWGRHRLVMSPSHSWWKNVKIGAGPTPIETSEGWLLIYHGVCQSCSGFIYSIGAALLDLDDPSKVIVDCEDYLLTPKEIYETVGFVPNVTFPCAAVCDSETGRIAIYYGAADTYVAVAFAYVEEIIEYIKAHPLKPIPEL
ncbi:MAG: glycoside hydrolase family 130 protein [Candidatus Marinimicrobia bacterium]|nr:glycoside hydrolase family 130 protein [Candidatus Neomarinimicrobiota bacterium]